MARGQRRRTDAPQRDWVIAGIAAAGLVLAAYLTATRLTSATALFCTTGGGCDIVQSSRYSMLLGLPTAAWGGVLYLVLGGLALAGLPPLRWRWAFVLSVAGVAFSAYLTYLELFVLRAICAYCLTSAGIAAALFVVLLVRRPAVTGRRSPVRPAILVPLALATAVLTVIVGVGAFVADTAGVATPYQEGLARHLARTGAVMYGAYW